MPINIKEKRGIIDVLRNGLRIYPANLIMFYQTFCTD
jgi:hypothetical protein